MRAREWVLVIAAQVSAWPANAAEPRADHQETQSAVVHIFVVGTTAESVRPIVDAFSRRDADLRLTHVSSFTPTDVMADGDSDVKARAWIEVSDSGRARITITDQRAVRFLVREATLPTWPDEVARETIVQMVESSVMALLEDERLGMSRAQATTVLAARDRRSGPAPSRAGHEQTAVVYWEAQLLAPQVPVSHGPGLGWHLTTPTHAGDFGLGTSLRYLLPLHADSATVGVELQSVAWRLGVELAGTFTSKRIRLCGLLGGGVDAVHVRPRQGTLGVATLTSARWTTVTVLRAELRVAFPLSNHAALSLAPSLEWTPLRPHYDVSGIDGTAAVVDPYLVRPGLSFGVEWR